MKTLTLEALLPGLVKRSMAASQNITENGRKLAVNLPSGPIAEFCRRWHVTELALFGSVLRGDFRPDSDVDVLVSFAADARWSLLDMARMEEELKKIIGREVDLVERKAVELSENYIRRRYILDSAEPVYVAR